VAYPFRATHVVDVDLPFDLPMTPETMDAVSPSLTMKFTSSYRNRRLTYNYNVETNADAVVEADMTAHAHAVDKAILYMGRSITFRPGPGGIAGSENDIHWKMIALAVLGLITSSWLSYRAYGMNRSIANSRIGEGSPAKFGGWLLLLGLNVLLSPFATLVVAWSSWRYLFTVAYWRALTTPDLPSYRPLLAALVVVEGIAYLLFSAYSCALVATWLKKRRSFPWHFSVFAAATAGFALTDHIGAELLGVGDPGGRGFLGPIRLVVFAAVWIAYLHRAKRVARTFVT
jgi:hypothetical protein